LLAQSSFTETATCVIARPIAVIFEAGVFLRAVHASHTAPTNCGTKGLRSLFRDPASEYIIGKEEIRSIKIHLFKRRDESPHNHVDA